LSNQANDQRKTSLGILDGTVAFEFWPFVRKRHFNGTDMKVVDTPLIITKYPLYPFRKSAISASANVPRQLMVRLRQACVAEGAEQIALIVLLLLGLRGFAFENVVTCLERLPRTKRKRSS
jgi:hypothetical protein